MQAALSLKYIYPHLSTFIHLLLLPWWKPSSFFYMDSFDGLLTAVLASFSVPYNPFSTEQQQHTPPYLKLSRSNGTLPGQPCTDQAWPPSLHSPSLLLCLPLYAWHSASPLPTPDFAGILSAWFLGLHWPQNQTHPT